MSKILKNQTSGDVEIVDVGVTVPADGNYTIPPEDYPRFAASSGVIRAMSSGLVILSDGGNDILNLSEAVNIMKNWCMH